MFDMIPFKRHNFMNKRGDYVDQFFDNFFNDDLLYPTMFTKSNLKTDLKETPDSYIVEADLPGIPKSCINVNYNNNYLTISAKREDTLENKDENYIRRERRYGEFRRSFYIDNVDENNIKASFNDGVLKITLPKLTKGTDNKKVIEIE